MDDPESYSNANVIETDVEECSSFHMEWFSGCSAKLRHVSASDALGLLWGKACLIDEIEASFCIKKTFDSAHIFNAITKVELERRFETYFNVRRIHRK